LIWLFFYCTKLVDLPYTVLRWYGWFLLLFSTVSMASGSFFMLCAPGHVFGGTEGIGSHFHVLRFQTHFRRYRGRPLPFSCFALTDTFSAVRRASGPVFMFCAPKLVFGGSDGVRSNFHVCVLHTHFRRFRRRRV
jgi:hypothetical protein